MSSAEAKKLVRKYGSRLKVAEALILGRLNPREEELVDTVVSPMIMEVAQFRIVYLGTPQPVDPAPAGQRSLRNERLRIGSGRHNRAKGRRSRS